MFESQAQGAVVNSLLEAKWKADQERQQEAQNKLDLYHDDYEDIITDIIKSLFCKENYDRLKFHINQSQNILKRVVNEISMVYKAEAKRNLDPKSPRYEEIKDQVNFDFLFKKVNRYTNLGNETIVKIGLRRDKLVFDIITPNICMVVQDDDDPTRMREIIYQVTLVNTVGSSSIEYHHWSDEGIYEILDEKLKIKETVHTPGDYPYKDKEGAFVLPFVVFHKNEPDWAFWDQDSGRDLYNATVSVGWKMTLFDYYFKTASFKQIYMIGDNLSVPDKQVMDPQTLFTGSGENASIGTLDLQPRLNELRDALVFQINSIINNYGISADAWTLSISEMSGRALKIKNRALLELRQDQEPLYRKAEGELFEIIRIVNNAHASALDWQKIPEEAIFSVDFGEIEWPEDPNEEIDLQAKRLKSGIISLGAFYQFFNPDITDEAKAEKAIIGNLEKLATTREEHPSLDEALNFIMKGGGPGTAKGAGEPFAKGE